jgi:hypothetical protein
MHLQPTESRSGQATAEGGPRLRGEASAVAAPQARPRFIPRTLWNHHREATPKALETYG